MLLTDFLLLNYKRCQRRAFLDVYGDPSQRDGERDFLLKLRQENQIHIESTLDKFYPHYQQVRSIANDWASKAQATEALMRQGVHCIYQGTIFLPNLTANPIFPMDESFHCLANPHLLVRQPGESKFGDWFYRPVSIHLGRRPKPEYKIVAAFYSQLLGYLQDIPLPIPILILREHNPYLVDLGQWLEKLEETVIECVTMLSQEEEPEVFISRQRCSLCHWHNHCYSIAQSQQHLSLVPGVTPSRYQSLQEMGLMTVESLADACPINMGEVIGTEVANQLQQQAQAIVENRPLRKSQFKENIHTLIPTAKVEFYFDIEAEPERNLDYLLGILRVERPSETQIFHPFLAETPETEGEIWLEFLNLVESEKDAPIFHFSEYEVETIKRLGKLYKTPPKQIERLLSRFVDLHARVITCVILPVESYSLKSLANSLGFHWRDPGMGGDQCVCWYDQWLKTSDRTFLASILRYNEDDCRATFHLKNWLLEFLG